MRSYHSPIRKQQADKTRQKVLTAARALILSKGLAATTIEAIAKKAGVATPTVYATFGSKKAIVGGLLDRVRFGEAYEAAVSATLDEKDLATQIRRAANVARTIYEAEHTELALLALSPELAEMERERDELRFEAQKPVLALAGRRLKLGLPEARAVMWAMTGRELYRSLVGVRGWTPSRYARWLGDALVDALLKPE